MACTITRPQPNWARKYAYRTYSTTSFYFILEVYLKKRYISPFFTTDWDTAIGEELHSDMVIRDATLGMTILGDSEIVSKSCLLLVEPHADQVQR